VYFQKDTLVGEAIGIVARRRARVIMGEEKKCCLLLDINGTRV
jgi:hypothetical protein